MEATKLREALDKEKTLEHEAKLVELSEALEDLERKLYETEGQLATQTANFEGCRRTLEQRIAENHELLDECFDELARIVQSAAGSEPRGELQQLLEDLESFDRWIAGHEAIIGSTTG